MTTPPRPPLSRRTSIWPAASVLIGAVVMLAVFMVIDVVTSTPVATTTTIPIVVGGLPVQSGTVSGAALLSRCNQDGGLPANIGGALVLPAPTTPLATAIIANQGAGEFDCFRTFTSTTTASDLLGFYANQLEARGWHLFSTGATNGDPQALFQKAGDDTFYWVVGITVTHTSGHHISWTYRIYQNSATI